ncbi:MAG: gliding motility protein GldB [Tannerellaceae bacterium]|jgi:hypothetical protein|nr:gliding motility protein GldB [Tannerellaceae bacterium]
MRAEILCILVWLLGCSGCKGQGSNAFSSAEPVRIHRFDKALLRLIESDNDVTIQGELLCDYPEMMDVVGKGVLNMPTPETPGFFERLTRYYSEPTLKGLYRDALALYDSISDIEQQLGSAFAYLGAHFREMPIPRVYMHVSGLNQNVLVAEHLLSVSIDKYMGKDYPLYQRFFYDFQREKMQRAHILPDYLSGWLMSEYPFTEREDVLLDRMIYEGKIKYIVSQALPAIPPHVLMGYTEEAYAWCGKNEPEVWKTIVGRKHLYTPDLITTRKYIEETPAAFLAEEAPGYIGVWIGWQIVRRYMEETGATPAMLMQETEAQKILTLSKYKPF